MEQIIEEAEIPQMIRFYDIVSKLGNMIYTGSTEMTIKQRFGQHKSQYKRWKNGKAGYTTSFDLFDKYGTESCKIVEISSQICDKSTRDAVESGRILLHRADIAKVCVNNRLPGVWTDAEKKAYDKQYQEEHVDALKAYRNEKNICNKCLGKFTTVNKTTHEKSNKHQQSLQPTIYNITINLNANDINK